MRALAELLVGRSRSSIGVAPGELRGAEGVGQLVDLVEVLADHEDPLALVLGDELLHDPQLRRGGRRQAVPLVVGARRVLQALLLRQIDAHLVAGRRGR